jgi:hypothetical protein
MRQSAFASELVRESVPSAPSRVTGIATVPIVKESSPAPLVMERAVTAASGRLLVEPSTVTEIVVASASTEIVWALAPLRRIVHGAGAGGDRPLAVFAFGSGALPAIPVNVFVVAAVPLDVPEPAPAVAPPVPDVPAAPVEAAVVVLGVSCGAIDAVPPSADVPVTVEAPPDDDAAPSIVCPPLEVPVEVADGAELDTFPLELVELVTDGPTPAAPPSALDVVAAGAPPEVVSVPPELPTLCTGAVPAGAAAPPPATAGADEAGAIADGVNDAATPSAP